jgi:hypothetical protein
MRAADVEIGQWEQSRQQGLELGIRERRQTLELEVPVVFIA